MPFRAFASVSAAALLVGLASPAAAQDRAPAADPAFDLGRIVVTGRRPEGLEITPQTLSAEAIRTFNRNTLDAAADLIPGVAASNSGGSRNERLIYVRGFDRFQVPLGIDGVRVYLPADNRLDYGRFLTPDVAEVQVSKGYASVLDGPGAMGGAINLVTRTPSQPMEGELRATLSLDGDADYAGQTVFALAGTRQETWYAQASWAQTYVDHWNLSEDYSPPPGSPEDGGERGFSGARDARLNLKAGITPNATDEYSLSYTRQEGSKNAPLHVGDPAALQRNWTWPFWDIDSLYFLSRTQVTDAALLKTRIYRNTFDNLLSAYDDATQSSQTRGRAFNSWYADKAWGGSGQLDLALSGADALSLAAHYRADEHVEYQQGFPSGATEPEQTNREDTWSLAAENRLDVSPALRLTAGVSYDWRDLKRAEEYGTPPGGGAPALFSYPIADAHAWNGQARLDWTGAGDAQAHAAVSSRARFPTIFERFSSRFGGAVSNPDLKAERATQVEVGGARRFGALRAEGAVFYAALDDVIVAYPFIYTDCSSGTCVANPVTQSRNAGQGETYGAELSVTARLNDALTLGGNYAWTKRQVDDPSAPAFEPTGVPEHQAFLYSEWTPLPRLTVTPGLDLASERYTVTTSGAAYYKTGGYALASLSIEYDIDERFSVGAGARNLFDANYTLTDGFPEAGRSLFLTLRARR